MEGLLVAKDLLQFWSQCDFVDLVPQASYSVKRQFHLVLGLQKFILTASHIYRLSQKYLVITGPNLLNNIFSIRKFVEEEAEDTTDLMHFHLNTLH
jgi:hypothetical protein